MIVRHTPTNYCFVFQNHLYLWLFLDGDWPYGALQFPSFLPALGLTCPLSHGRTWPEVPDQHWNVRLSEQTRPQHAEGIRQRISNLESKPKSTVRNLVSAVRSFECWLDSHYAKPEDKGRNIEDIPPKELDEYLVDFFAVVTKQSGKQYDRDSFKSVRSYLDRFLKERQYPYSISKSGMFVKSQESYFLRRQALQRLSNPSVPPGQYTMNDQDIVEIDLL